jgi:hypothetical protein
MFLMLYIVYAQVFSCILKHLTTGLPQLNMNGKTKTPAAAFGAHWHEHEVSIHTYYISCASVITYSSTSVVC